MPQLLFDVAEMTGHWTIKGDETFIAWCDEAYTAARRVIEQPAAPKYAGPCRECGEDVYMRPQAITASCEHCGVRIEASEQVEWVASHLEDKIMTLSEIRTALAIMGFPRPMSTLKTWVQRKRLVAVSPGRYKLADALSLADVV